MLPSEAKIHRSAVEDKRGKCSQEAKLNNEAVQPGGLLHRQKYLSQIRFPQEVNMAENEFGCDIYFAKRQRERENYVFS